jgi:transcriptional regulator with XRE-family HTH domain
MKETAKTIFDPRYDRLISDLVRIRHEKGFTQRSFSAKTGYSKCFIGRTETKERRLDVVETIDYMRHLGLSNVEIIRELTALV